jgi:O-antigen/teichoic acid export membrane protein
MKYIKLHSKISSFIGVFGATAFNNFSSFIIIVFTARLFGPAEFGKLSLAIAIMSNLSTILDFGTNFSLVRFYSQTESEVEKKRLLRVITKWNIALLLIVLILSFPGEKIITTFLPILKNTPLLVYFVFISSSILNIVTTVRAIEQSQKEFISVTKYYLILGFLRLSLFTIILVSVKISITNIFLAIHTLPLLILVFITPYKTVGYLFDNYVDCCVKKEIQILKSLLKYSFWVAITGFLSVMSYQIPQFVLAYRANPIEVGLYGAAITFLPFFTLINNAIRTLMLPDIMAIKNSESRLEFRAKMRKKAPVFFCTMFVVLFLLAGLQYVILGNLYKASIPIFLVLGFSSIVWMYFNYLNTLIHSIGIPEIETKIIFFRVLIIVVLISILPKFAIIMSLVFGIVSIGGEIYTYMAIKKLDCPEVVKQDT